MYFDEFRLRECTRAAIAVRRFKKKFGRLPIRVAELSEIGFVASWTDIPYVFHEVDEAVYISTPALVQTQVGSIMIQ